MREKIGYPNDNNLLNIIALLNIIKLSAHISISADAGLLFFYFCTSFVVR